MAQIFIARAELMPVGETTEEHLIAQQEEAGMVERDRSNTDSKTGGLFRGCFRGYVLTNFHRILRDVEDGVDRCPYCAWELEAGFCNSCQQNIDSDFEGDDFYDHSDDSEIGISETEMTVSDGYNAHGPEADWMVPPEHPDDISLDGDGLGIHTPRYDDNFAFGRAGAQGLIGRTINRGRSPPTGQHRRRYAPSMLSDVAATHQGSVGDFSDTDEVDEEDGGSLDGFLVDDEDGEVRVFQEGSVLGSSRDSLFGDGQDNGIIDQDDNFPIEHPSESYWVDDSALSSDVHNQTDHEAASESSSNSSDESSEPETPLPIAQSRKRRRIVLEDSSGEESDSESASERSRPRRRISSSGSATVGRHSPVLGSSRFIPERPVPNRLRRRAEAPIMPISSDSDSDLPPQSPVNRRRRPRVNQPRLRSRMTMANHSLARPRPHQQQQQQQQQRLNSYSNSNRSGNQAIQPPPIPAPTTLLDRAAGYSNYRRLWRRGQSRQNLDHES
ncbi:E3 ubiquitin ligase [Xylographa opegraphella]|nr:E3 ubiquitin ligase [Xylographa opegraphella]